MSASSSALVAGAVVVLGVWTLVSAWPRRVHSAAWYATIAAAIAAAALTPVRDFGAYGLGTPNGCQPPPDSYAALSLQGSVVEIGATTFAVRLPVLLVACLFSVPALVAPLYWRWLARRRAGG